MSAAGLSPEKVLASANHHGSVSPTLQQDKRGFFGVLMDRWCRATGLVRSPPTRTQNRDSHDGPPRNGTNNPEDSFPAKASKAS